MNKRARAVESRRKSGSEYMPKNACPPARAGGTAIWKCTTPQIRALAR
jgi:hypothetical protein